MKITAALKKLYNVIYKKAAIYKRGVGWVLALVVMAIILLSYQLDLFERLELLTLDWRFNLRHVSSRPQDIVFIDMADDSVDVIGRWPWPRKWHAALIKILTPYKPKAIAFDVIFSEPQEENDDAALEEAIRQSGVVYMPSVYNLDFQRARSFYKGEGVGYIYEPMPRLMAQLKGSGHINAIPDSDGILRRVPPVISYKGKVTYQLGIRIASDILGIKEGDIDFKPDRYFIALKRGLTKPVKIPLDRNNRLIVNWLAKWGEEFKHYSYIDVIKSYASIQQAKPPVIDLNVFRDKVCIVGLTALGLIDIKPIPIENAYPAVGTNAMVISSILNNDFIKEAPQGIDVLLLLFISVVITLYLCNLRLLSGMILTMLSIICYAVFSVALFALFNTIVVTFYPILSIAFSYVLTASFTQILQSVERARLFKQATRDGLTRLYNIRHFNLLLEAEFRNTSVYKIRNLSIIMADLDNFKKANDTYGHQAGDVILRETAYIVQSKCRQMDIVGRYGGEEFIIMLAGSKASDAADVGEKIRQAVEEKKFRFKNEAYSTTISIGVAQYTGEKKKEELVEKADSALYHAKRAGRNRVCVYSKEMGLEKSS